MSLTRNILLFLDQIIIDSRLLILQFIIFYRTRETMTCKAAVDEIDQLF